MHDEPLPAMLFPSPSNELIQQASADAPRGQLWSWMHALPQTIQQCLSRWQIEWTGESQLKQGYLGYVLPCRCQDGTPAVLKLSPDAHGAQEQAIALSAWAGPVPPLCWPSLSRRMGKPYEAQTSGLDFTENLVSLLVDIASIKKRAQTSSNEQEFFLQQKEKLFRNAISLLLLAKEPIRIRHLYEMIVTSPVHRTDPK